MATKVVTIPPSSRYLLHAAEESEGRNSPSNFVENHSKTLPLTGECTFRFPTAKFNIKGAEFKISVNCDRGGTGVLYDFFATLASSPSTNPNGDCRSSEAGQRVSQIVFLGSRRHPKTSVSYSYPPCMDIDFSGQKTCTQFPFLGVERSFPAPDISPPRHYEFRTRRLRHLLVGGCCGASAASATCHLNFGRSLFPRLGFRKAKSNSFDRRRKRESWEMEMQPKSRREGGETN